MVSTVSSSWNLSSLGECDRLSLVRNIDAFEAAFVAYGRAVCDGLVSDCFVLDNADFVRHAAGICDVLRHSCHLDPSAMGQVCNMILAGTTQVTLGITINHNAFCGCSK